MALAAPMDDVELDHPGPLGRRRPVRAYRHRQYGRGGESHGYPYVFVATTLAVNRVVRTKRDAGFGSPAIRTHEVIHRELYL